MRPTLDAEIKVVAQPRRAPIGYMKPASCNNYSQPALTSLLHPVFKFLAWVGICSQTFHFECIRDECKGRGMSRSFGGGLRKCFAAVLALALLIHTFGHLRLWELHISGHILLMYRVVAFAYAFNYTAIFCCLNIRGHRLQKLLCHINQLETEFGAMGAKIWSRRKALATSVALLTAYTTFALSFMLNAYLHGATLLGAGFQNWTAKVVQTAALELSLVMPVGVNVSRGSSSSTVWNGIMAAPFFALSILFDLCWTMGLLINLVWGIVFYLLFKAYFQVITANGSQSCSVAQLIRYFNKVQSCLEDYNEVFSAMTFAAVLSGLSHFSVYLMTVFNSETSVLDTSFTLVDFAMFWIQLIAAAEVNRMAGKVAKALRNRYQEEDWNGSVALDRADPKVTHALMILLADLNSKNVGFDGLCFFTVSYALIGSVLSLIITYTIVALDFSA